MKRFLRNTALLTLIILSFSLFGCTKKPENKDTVTLRLNEVVRSVFYGPMYVAINKGFFKEEGFDIDLTTGQGADKTMQQVLSGNADIGFCGPEQVVYLYNQGREDYAVLFAQLTQTDGSFIVGRSAENNFSWDNLKGKTIIGGRPGGVPEMTLEYVLRNHGLYPNKDVTIITNLAFTATASAFVSGTGDYVALFEPTASMLEKEGSGYVVSSLGVAGGEIPYTCFFATKSYIEKNPETIEKFVRALYKGYKWVEEHSSKEVAEACISFFPGTDLDILTKVVDRYRTQGSWASSPVFKKDSYSRLLDIIQSYNRDLLPSRPPYEKVIDNSFAEKVISQFK